MRIYYNQLQQTLAQSPSPIWLVFGDEPWQKNDSLYQIKNAAKSQGFDELVRFTVDDKFSWDELANEYCAMSLFASRRIIELEFLTSKINEAGIKTLTDITNQLTNDVILLCHGDKLDTASTNKKWFKTLSKVGTYLPLYELDRKGLAMWLNKQIRYYQLNLNHECIELMLGLFEGNVLALDQELQKLSILYAQQPISVDIVSELLINQAKFNPFALIDAWLAGDIGKCILMLDQMQQEGIAFAKVLFFINKELNQLKKMHQCISSGQSMNDIFKQFKVWDKRKPLYQYALQNSNTDNVLLATHRIADVDTISKTSSEFNPFQLLADVCICLYKGSELKAFSFNYH